MVVAGVSVAGLDRLVRLQAVIRIRRHAEIPGIGSALHQDLGMRFPHPRATALLKTASRSE